jgi:hypothetical protein
MYKKYKNKLDECLNRYHEIEVRTRPLLWMTDDLTLPCIFSDYGQRARGLGEAFHDCHDGKQCAG